MFDHIPILMSFVASAKRQNDYVGRLVASGRISGQDVDRSMLVESVVVIGLCSNTHH